MSNAQHAPFTTGFTTGLLGQTTRIRLRDERERRRQASLKRLDAMRLSRPGMPAIRMYVSPWSRDEHGMPTRFIRNVDAVE